MVLEEFEKVWKRKGKEEEVVVMFPSVFFFSVSVSSFFVFCHDSVLIVVLN